MHLHHIGHVDFMSFVFCYLELVSQHKRFFFWSNMCYKVVTTVLQVFVTAFPKVSTLYLPN